MQQDLLVIGGGPGGYVAAIRASQLGLRTALVEEDALGGTCLNRGCVPTKALLYAAGLYREADRWQELGLSLEGKHCDFSAMHRRKNAVVAQLRDGVAQLLRANGVEILSGRGRILDGQTVQVGERTVSARRILLAVGSVPAIPPIPGAELPGVVTSDHLLQGEGIDCRRLLIVGGGVIGVEMASLYSALGRKVTIVEALERLVPNLDREIAQNLTMLFKKQGIEVYTGATVDRICRGSESGVLSCSFHNKKEEKNVEADAVLISTGRRPRTAGLFGDGMDVARTARGFIRVDETFQTSVPTIYAVGDVIGRAQLAHAAEAQGIAAAEILAGAAVSVEHTLIPACVYTEPEIASVGITEAEAREAGRTVTVGKYVMNGNAKTVIAQQERSFVKLVFDSESGVLLGAQLMCARATDLISELTTAVSLGLTREQLARTVRPHPTFGEAVGEAVAAAAGESIHSMPRRR